MCSYCDCECDTEAPTKTIVVSANRLAREIGSCNFCNRQITEWGTKANARVVEISGSGLSARICYPCLAELKRLTASL